jgi:Terminase large subunit gpA, endonuclease domain
VAFPTKRKIEFSFSPCLRQTIFNKLSSGRGIRFSNTLPPTFFEQLTSEKRVVRYRFGRPVIRFERKAGALAEGLDALVLCHAARAAVRVVETREQVLTARARAPAQFRDQVPFVTPGGHQGSSAKSAQSEVRHGSLADTFGLNRDVCFVPQADIRRRLDLLSTDAHIAISPAKGSWVCKAAKPSGQRQYPRRSGEHISENVSALKRAKGWPIKDACLDAPEMRDSAGCYLR